MHAPRPLLGIPQAWWGRLGQAGLVRLKSFNLYRNAKEMKEFGWSRPKTLVWANNALPGGLEWTFITVKGKLGNRPACIYK